MLSIKCTDSIFHIVSLHYLRLNGTVCPVCFLRVMYSKDEIRQFNASFRTEFSIIFFSGTSFHLSGIAGWTGPAAALKWDVNPVPISWQICETRDDEAYKRNPRNLEGLQTFGR